MKKAVTIIFAALLSGAMLVGMTACNNGGGNDQQSSGAAGQSTVNPFFPTSFTSTESTAVSDVSTDSQPGTSITETSIESSMPVSDASVVLPSTEPSQPESEPPVSTVSEPEPPQSSAVVSFVVESDDEPDESDWDDSDIDDSDIDDSDPDDSSWDYSKVTPKGTVVPEYAGSWSFVYDFASMDPEEASLYQSMIESMGISVEMKLDLSGSAVLSVASGGQTSSTDTGKWSAEGSSIYVTIDGDTAEFKLSDGKLTSDFMEGGYFIKN